MAKNPKKNPLTKKMPIDAATGHIISAKRAKERPKTTVTLTVPVRRPKKKK